MRKLLSYLWPKTEKIVSDYNGVLEVTYINGKKVLDSENANYSYGSLQKILRKGISTVDLTKVKTVLLLGLGGGCVLSEFKDYAVNITAVELDKQIIEIAKKEFLVKETNTFKIVNTDAFAFMQSGTKKHDLIIIDLFIDNKVPAQFYKKEFCNYLYNALTNKGSLIFNLGMHNAESQESVIQFFKDVFCEIQVFTKVENTNTLLVVKKKL